VGGRLQTTLRRLRHGDEDVVRALAEPPRPPRVELLGDDRTIYLAAFADGEPIGFVLAYELLRRHGDPSLLFVYEVDVAPPFRRRGVAAALFDELERLARERGIREGFVLTDADNDAANALYASRRGVRVETVMWDFPYADA
jgi:ribosomal protein S18 acetylase RimI-like enzyme